MPEICWSSAVSGTPEMWPGDTLGEVLHLHHEGNGHDVLRKPAPRTDLSGNTTRGSALASSAPTASWLQHAHTGRIELYSTLFTHWGQRPVPLRQSSPLQPQPVPARFDKDEYPERYPLIMTTGARQWRRSIRAYRQIPHPRAPASQPLNFEIALKPPRERWLGYQHGDWC